MWKWEQPALSTGECGSEMGPLLVALAICLWLYFWSVKTYGHWRARGVPYVEPVPLFGNSFTTLFSLKSSAENHIRIYNQLKPNPYGGTFSMRTPVLLVISPGIVEHFLIKDFASFYNRGTNVDGELDPLSMHLVHLEDGRWRNLRTKLTPVFSSGKLRTMEDKLISCGDVLVEYVKLAGVGPHEARELMSRFTTDVIGTVAFGIGMNAIKEPNSEFRQVGKKIFEATMMNRIRHIIRQSFPKILKLLRWKSASNKSSDFFIRALKETVAHREASGTRGNDFLQLLIDLRRQENTASELLKSSDIPKPDKNGEDTVVLDDKLLMANAFVFFAAGFETTASTLSYCLFELAQHQHIQQRLYTLIKEALDGSQPTYDNLKKVPYLEQVINETLRIYPPAFATIRKCTKDYEVPDGSGLIIRKGDNIQVPIYAIHHDPDNYPDPETFDPERFAPGNKIVKGSFIPFGDGPRICIGMRFAMYEMKVVLSKLLLEFKITTNNKTQLPLKFNKKTIFLVPEKGLWVDFNPRS